MTAAAFAVPCGAAQAQGQPECVAVAIASLPAGRVCQAAIDAARGFHPVVGLLTSGGAAVPGTGAVQGGFGRFAIAARVNASRITLADPRYDGTTATVPAERRVLAPSPVVEAAVGIFPGRNGTLGVDLLGSAQLIPTDAIDNLTVSQDARRIGSVALGLGYGVRLGLLGETASRPAVAVSVMRRHLPRVTYGDVTARGDAFAFSSDLTAWNVRVVASKRVGAVIAGLGGGWDRFSGDAEVRYRPPIGALPAIAIPLALRHERWQAFGNLGLALGPVRLTGEVGYQFGRQLGTVTTFEQWDPNAGRWYGVVGVGFGI